MNDELEKSLHVDWTRYPGRVVSSHLCSSLPKTCHFPMSMDAPAFMKLEALTPGKHSSLIQNTIVLC